MSYKSSPASTTNYGLVKIGNGISVSNGVISTSGSGGSTIGTWVPTITSSIPATISLNISNANYCKVGQEITCYFDFKITVLTGGGGSGTLTLNGLPFTSISGNGFVGNLIVTYFENLDSNQSFIVGTISGSSTQSLLWVNRVSTSSARLTQGDIKVSTRLTGMITYLCSNTTTSSSSAQSSSSSFQTS